MAADSFPTGTRLVLVVGLWLWWFSESFEPDVVATATLGALDGGGTNLPCGFKFVRCIHGAVPIEPDDGISAVDDTAFGAVVDVVDET